MKVTCMEALMGTLRKETIARVTCWELKSHLFKASVLPTFMYGIEVRGGNLKNSHWKVFKKHVTMHMMSHIKVCSLTLSLGFQAREMFPSLFP